MRGHPRAKTPVFAPGVKPWNNWDAAGSREKWEGPLGKWEIGKSFLGKNGKRGNWKKGANSSRRLEGTGGYRPAGRPALAHRVRPSGASGRELRKGGQEAQSFFVTAVSTAALWRSAEHVRWR